MLESHVDWLSLFVDMMMDGSPDYLDDRSMYNGLSSDFVSSAYGAPRYVAMNLLIHLSLLHDIDSVSYFAF